MGAGAGASGSVARLSDRRPGAQAGLRVGGPEDCRVKRHYGMIRQSAVRAAQAASEALGLLEELTVLPEPAVTDRMLDQIERALDGFEVNEVRWETRAVLDRGKAQRERSNCAGFAVVLDLHLPDYRVQKGFLARCKWIEPADHVSPVEWDWLRQQCQEMLGLSSAAYLCLYSRQGISLLPAQSILNAERCNPHALYTRSLQSFLEPFLECFLGDPALRIGPGGAQEDLERLRDRCRTAGVLYLSAAPTAAGAQLRLFELGADHPP